MHPSEKQTLNKQLTALNNEIEAAIDVVKVRAAGQEMSPYEVMYTDGKMVIAPLLLAKAEVLSAKVKLNVKTT